LAGPTEAEKSQGYYTNINPGVQILSLVIVNGVARADFDQSLQEAVGGSCRVAAIRTQITQTLKQFSTVKSVTISVNGDSATSLQP
jgi:spore germination protein GerM